MTQCGGGIRENARLGEAAERAVYEHLRANCGAVRRAGSGSGLCAAGCESGVKGVHRGAKANCAPPSPPQRGTRERPGGLHSVGRMRCDGSGGCECP